MNRLLVLIAASLLAISSFASAYIITVDCTGAGDYEDLPQAVLAAGPEDTVMVAPCVYAVAPGTPGYPIPIHEASPTIMSEEGAEVTILEGDGTSDAFQIVGAPLGSRTRIHGFTIRNVQWPIRNDLNGGYFEVTGNILEGNAYGLDVSNGGYIGSVAKNVIRDCGGTGLYIYHFFATVDSNEISHCSAGIEGVCCEEPTITGNHIHHNTFDGITTGFFAHVEHNTIEHNGRRGVSIFGTPESKVRHNIIRGNDVGVYVAGYSDPEITLNDIYDNTSCNLECSTEIYGTPLDATMNWWGTTDPDEISASIRDCYDDPLIECCVLFEPWCYGPGCPQTVVKDGGVSWGTIKAMFR
jgi:hypothetical protein